MLGYEQLLCHLVGDFLLQNDYQALGKKDSKWIVLLHGFLYTLPFIFITQSIPALIVIGLSHAIIDGGHLIKQINKVRNWNFKTDTGFKSDRPLYLTTWLLIIQDNVWHLLINYFAIKYL